MEKELATVVVVCFVRSSSKAATGVAEVGVEFCFIVSSFVEIFVEDGSMDDEVYCVDVSTP